MFKLINRRTIAVIKREVKAQVLSKAFIFMTLFMPILMFGLIGFQVFLTNFDNEGKMLIEVVSKNSNFLQELEKEMKQKSFVKSGEYEIHYILTEEAENNYLNKNKSKILADKLSGIIFISDSSFLNKNFKYFSKNPNNLNINTKLGSVFNKVVVSKYFSDKNLSGDDIYFAQKRIKFPGYRVTEDEKAEKEGFGGAILAGIFVFLLYLSTLMIGMNALRSVTEEKNNRVVEILLSSTNSTELMTGKIIGSAATGLLQMIIWLAPITIVGFTGFFAAYMNDINIGVTLFQLLYFLLNYILGVTTFVGLFAAVGAIFDNDQDAQQGVMPVMMLILIPFYITFSLFKNPLNIIGQVSSLLPFASLMVMPARIVLIDVPVYEVILAVIVNLLTLLFVFSFVGKIYKVGILMTGKKPKWSEVWQWIRQN
jgi:ABC-2 type transport system permease protein